MLCDVLLLLEVWLSALWVFGCVFVCVCVVCSSIFVVCFVVACFS